MRNSFRHLSLVGLLLATSSMNTFADDKSTAAQLDTTPPPADTALTPDQTPPFTVPSAAETPSGGSIGKTATADETAPEELAN